MLILVYGSCIKVLFLLIFPDLASNFYLYCCSKTSNRNSINYFCYSQFFKVIVQIFWRGIYLKPYLLIALRITSVWIYSNSDRTDQNLSITGKILSLFQRTSLKKKCFLCIYVASLFPLREPHFISTFPCLY